jgi:hypothetical protein
MAGFLKHVMSLKSKNLTCITLLEKDSHFASQDAGSSSGITEGSNAQETEKMETANNMRRLRS